MKLLCVIVNPNLEWAISQLKIGKIGVWELLLEILAGSDDRALRKFSKSVDLAIEEIAMRTSLDENIEILRWELSFWASCHSGDYSDNDRKDEDRDPGALEFREGVYFLY